MALAKTGNGVTDISGSMAGNVFARDSSGLHIRPKPRRVNSPTPAQLKQRNAFAKARTYSKDNRTVSYLIYRALNDLPFLFDAIVTGDPDPDCTGKYVLAENKHNGANLYQITVGPWLIFYHSVLDRWYLTNDLEAPTVFWWRPASIQGEYGHTKPEWGNPFVTLIVQPPPVGYEIPRL